MENGPVKMYLQFEHGDISLLCQFTRQKYHCDYPPGNDHISHICIIYNVYIYIWTVHFAWDFSFGMTSQQGDAITSHIIPLPSHQGVDKKRRPMMIPQRRRLLSVKGFCVFMPTMKSIQIWMKKYIYALYSLQKFLTQCLFIKCMGRFRIHEIWGM